jgi:hypothetical protein
MREVACAAGARLAIFFVPASIAVCDPSALSYVPWDQTINDTARYDRNRPWANLLDISNRLQIPAVDLTPLLKAHSPQPVYFKDSWHWNEEGHKAAAAAIARTLLDGGYLDGAALPPLTSMPEAGL